MQKLRPMAADKITTPKPNKSEFIRSQPPELPAAAVVEKAKAEGVSVTTGLVYEVRSQSKAKRKTKKGAAGKSSAVPKGGAPTFTSKADFVRKFPKASPKEIITKALAEGLKIDLDYVYKVRSSVKAAKGRTTGETVAAIPRKGASVPRPMANASSAENLLKAVAAEIGLGRAIEILSGERERVRALIGR